MSLSKLIACLTGIALFSSVLPAQTPAYFPLQVGNTWLYRMAGGTYQSISVDGQETIGGQQYFDVTYFGRSELLRLNAADGTVFALNRQSGTEQQLLSLLLPEGSSFQSHIDPCTQKGAIATRSADVKVPAGEFPNAVRINFQGSCADAGTTQQFYANYVGLVRHEETSFAGPRQYDLVYYRVGSTSGSGSELSFTTALDAPGFQAGGNMGVRLTLRSTSPNPIPLTFPSAQDYDLKIYDASGNVVYTWSDGKAFATMFRQISFGPGEKTYAFTVPLGTLPPGKYKAQGYLTTSPVMYLGEVSFEIAAASPAQGSARRPHE